MSFSATAEAPISVRRLSPCKNNGSSESWKLANKTRKKELKKHLAERNCKDKIRKGRVQEV